MPLILAIQPDRRQSAALRALIEGLGAELALGDTTANAFSDLGDRTPDLVLTSSALPPDDEAALVGRLRALDAAGGHAPTLVVPHLREGEGDSVKEIGGLMRPRPANHTDVAAGTPADFAKDIVAALERGAAERDAVAAAQAELDAVWAETAWTAPAVDVHPGMIVDDPEALFGEFAAIPIRAVGDPAEAFCPAADTAEDVNTGDADDDEWPPPTPRFVAPPAEEEWQEIALDSLDEVAELPEPAEGPVAAHDVEAADGGVDLDAFVQELETVRSNANAQPMIPVIDLSYVDPETIVGTALVPVDETELRLAEPPAPPPEPWREQLNLISSPLAAPPQPTAPHELAPTPAWSDLLSAIRRDIGRPLSTGETAATATPTTTQEFTATPLVFPSRTAAAAQILAAIESGTAGRLRAEPAAEARQPSGAPRPEAALAELLESVNAEAAAAVSAMPLTSTAAVPSPLAESPAIDIGRMASAATSQAELSSAVVDSETARCEPPPEASAANEAIASAPVGPDVAAPLSAPVAVISSTSKPARKRKAARSMAPTVDAPAVPEPSVSDPAPDWGFFDAHEDGFAPLLAKMNAVSGRRPQARR